MKLKRCQPPRLLSPRLIRIRWPGVFGKVFAPVLKSSFPCQRVSVDRHRLTVVLPKEEYVALEALADRQERTAPQQATWLLRQALTQGEGDQGKEGNDDD